MLTSITESPTRLVFSIKTLAEMTDLSERFLRAEIRQGKLKANKFGDRVLVTRENWDAYVGSRPEWKPKNER